MKKWRVNVERKEYGWRIIEAESEEHAKEIAYNDGSFHWDDTDTDITITDIEVEE